MNTTSDPRTAGPSPTQIPRGAYVAPALAPAADACMNFNLMDGRLVCLSVPIGIAEGDVPFILAVMQAHVTAVARRGHNVGYGNAKEYRQL